MQATQKGCPSVCCIYLLSLLSCFLLPVNGFFVDNCNIKGSLKHPENLAALCNKRALKAVPRNMPDQTRVLDLSSNEFSNITKNDLIHLTKLKHLNVSHNFIQDVEEGAFRSLTALQELNLADNNLKSIAGGIFQNLFNLTVLRLDGNQITNISASSFVPLISLIMLNLSGNHLSHINRAQSAFQLLNILHLHIGKNGLSVFQTSQVSNTSLKLKALDMSQNPLQVFRITADIFPHLESLNLAFNNGSMTWDVQDPNYFRNVSNLNLTGMQKTPQELELVLQTFNNSLTNLRLHQFREQTVKPLIKIACQINTLKILHLQYNSISILSENDLTYCTNVVTLDLSENSITNITDLAFRSLIKLNTLSLSRNKLNSVPIAIGNLPTLETLDLSYNSITRLKLSDFHNLVQLHTLNIYKNYVSSIESNTFQNLNNLKSLNIGSNMLISITECFKSYLPNLEFLGLTKNKLNSIRNGDFQKLVSLTHLLLNENQITTIEKGAFEGLSNLNVLHLQSNKIEQSSLRASVFSGLKNLKYLLLNKNYISYSDQDNLSEPPFTNLKSLDTLEIHSQGHKGMLNIPSNFLGGLSSLQVFTASNLNLNSLHPNTFTHTLSLCSLDLSKNELTSASSELFIPLRKLERLYMSSTGLQSLDFLVQANVSEIQILQISKNTLAVINETTISSFDNLMYIDLQGNTFTCDCSNAWFVNWAVKNNDTQVFNADQLTCNYPSKLRGNKLMELDLEFCTLDKEFVLFISTTTSIVLIMISSMFYHFLRWQVAYAYYRLLAFVYDSNHQRKKKSSSFQYDAFISYNTHDEQWVMTELLPQVEGQQGWKLCLHHRDFQPGKPIMENIVEGIYSSRKTICVISHHYLESEWCSREIQVASFRLFDEKKDVLILVFLENIPTDQLSPYFRMRKLVKKRTYITWPKPGQDTRVFWQKLRVALETKGTSEEESCILSGLGN